MLTISIIFSLSCCLGYAVMWGARGWFGLKYRNNPEVLARYDKIFDRCRWILVILMLIGVVTFVIALKQDGQA